MAGIDWGYVVKKNGVIQKYDVQQSVKSQSFKITFYRRHYECNEVGRDGKSVLLKSSGDLEGVVLHKLLNRAICGGRDLDAITTKNIHGKLCKSRGSEYTKNRWITRFKTGGCAYEVLFGYGIPNDKSELKLMRRYDFSLKERLFVRRWFG